MLVVHFLQRIFGRASRFGGAGLERYHEIPMFVDSAHISVYSSPFSSAGIDSFLGFRGQSS